MAKGVFDDVWVDDGATKDALQVRGQSTREGLQMGAVPTSKSQQTVDGRKKREKLAKLHIPTG